MLWGLPERHRGVGGGGLKSVYCEPADWKHVAAKELPVRGSPVRGSPVRGSSVRGSPVRGLPVRGLPVD